MGVLAKRVDPSDKENAFEGQKPGSGGRNTHLALLAAEKMDQHSIPSSRLDREAIRKGLMKAGISESQIETSEVGCLGYATDVGPISLTPMAVVGVRIHSDVEKAVGFAYEHNIPINARGAGSGLPGSVCWLRNRPGYALAG